MAAASLVSTAWHLPHYSLSPRGCQAHHVGRCRCQPLVTALGFVVATRTCSSRRWSVGFDHFGRRKARRGEHIVQESRYWRQDIGVRSASYRGAPEFSQVAPVASPGQIYGPSANRRRQQGHSPSKPLTRDQNADGWGNVIIALNASGPRLGVMTVSNAPRPNGQGFRLRILEHAHRSTSRKSSEGP